MHSTTASAIAVDQTAVFLISSLPNQLLGVVNPLSEVVTEKLQDACKSDSRCRDEELFKQGTRTEKGRCCYVQKVLLTLKYDELARGLCRMYYTQYN